VAFYLLSGLAAALGQIITNPSSAIPMVGASGAISGVMGGYLLLSVCNPGDYYTLCLCNSLVCAYLDAG
jgi:membrane associated rhomboid family serine protease